jgi:basic amino acid/polyamine antiporter, APA family
VVGVPAGIWDIDTFAEPSNIGTLFAFVLVSLGVIVLRRKQPQK